MSEEDRDDAIEEPGPEPQDGAPGDGAAEQPEAAGEGGDEASEEAPPRPERSEEAPPESVPAAEAPAGEDGGGERPEAERPEPERPPAERRERRRRGRGGAEDAEEEVIPGAHLEPDLVLEDQAAEPAPEVEFADEFAAVEQVAAPEEEPVEEEEEEEEPVDARPVAPEPLDLAADARYRATGKRKSAVARVTLRPGSGTYSINGRHLDQFFPRVKLQRMAKQPLEAAGYGARMDVVARIHGGGVSAQAGALRHGIARALVEADPNLRVELKRRGYLTRDPRVKERKKAGLKKARKRPQFSKR